VLPLQVDSVEEMKRRDVYERSQALRRIEDESQRTRQLQEQRRQLQDQRRLANMQASMQRQQIVQVRDCGA
jgi:ribosomal protein S21